MTSLRWLLVLSAAITVFAQDVPTDPVPKSRKPTEFYFARLEYTPTTNEYDIKNWNTDYPVFENHLTVLINKLTNIRIDSVRVKPASKMVFSFPFIYIVEPERVSLTNAEAANIHEWLLRGGLLLVDDFHGSIEMDLWRETLQKIWPDAVPVQLDTTYGLFHIFFDIPEIEQVVNDGVAACAAEGCEQFENGPSGKDPQIWATFASDGRLLVLEFYNTDTGDSIEWADDPLYPLWMVKYGTKILANTILWALSH